MKRVRDIILATLVFLIFIPLFLLMFFAMPVEFVASSWHVYRLDSSVEGVILSSEVTRAPSTQGNAIRYRFTVNGEVLESDRWSPGLISNSAKETGGGDLACKYKAGDEVTVYYDSSSPDFSVLERGWPKWSVGFSMGVWGIILGGGDKKKGVVCKGSLLRRAVFRSLVFTGFVVLAVFPSTLSFTDLRDVLCVYLVIALVNYFWLKFTVK